MSEKINWLPKSNSLHTVQGTVSDSDLFPFPVNEEGVRGWGKYLRRPFIVFTLLLFLFLAIPALAQENTSTVTDDDVNAIARQMYCPVCENIPLDVCPTEACAQWRAEIRVGLESGKTGDQIIAEFVDRYGDRVVGTPQDPTLRTLSLATPWVIAGVVALVAAVLLVRWWRGRGAWVAAIPAPGSVETSLSDDDYRARLERDLQARR